MASLAHWMVALSQGLVFFHAGDELLRSKSLDRDSYDSGPVWGLDCFLGVLYHWAGWLLDRPPYASSRNTAPQLRKQTVSPDRAVVIAACIHPYI